MNVRGSIRHSGLACGYDARGEGSAGSTSQLGTAHRDAFLATIVESTDDAIIGKSLEGIVFSWNAGAERLYGYSSAEMLGKPISRIVPPDRGKELRRIIARLRLGKRVDSLETVRQRKDGARIHVSLTVSPIISDDGRILGASSIARDITDRRRAQAAERDALMRLSALVETAVDEIITIDEREEIVKGRRRPCEEIERHSSSDVICEGRSPCSGWWLAMSDSAFAHGRLGNACCAPAHTGSTPSQRNTEYRVLSGIRV